MKYNKPHYLDTNIFISISLQDKFKEKCEEYFEKNYKKYTSQKVKKESYNVIKKLIHVSYEILNEIDEYVSLNKIPDEEIYFHIKHIQKNFLNKYSSKNYPFGFKKDKFKQISEEIFMDYFSELIKNNAYLPIIKIINNERKNIGILLKESNKSLNYLFGNIHVLNFDRHIFDENILKNLEKHGIHSPDNHILLDSYKTAKLLNKSIIFITMDKGIIKRKEFILKEFKSEIDVKHPKEYINN